MTQLSTQEFIDELRRLQAAEVAASNATNPNEMPMLVRLQMRYRAGDKLSTRDADILKLCTQLFRNEIESLDCDPRLINLAQRLQIPVLIAAIENSGFFGREGHPARNLVGRVSSRLLDSSGASPEQVTATAESLQKLTDRLLALDSFPSRAFEDAAAELGDSSGASTASVSSAPPEPPLARRKVAIELQRRFPEQQLPPMLRELISQGWSRVLYNALLKGGEGSRDWQDGLLLVEGLMSCFSPDIDVQQRNRTLEELPGWIDQLRKGLSRATTLTPRMEKLLGDIQILILERVRENTAGEQLQTAEAERTQLDHILIGSHIERGPEDVPRTLSVAGTPFGAGCFVLRSGDGATLLRMPESELQDQLENGGWRHLPAADVMIGAVERLQRQSRSLRNAPS